MTLSGCRICEKLAVLPSLPPSENVYQTQHWSVVHAFDSALEGWLVLLSRTHALSYAELADKAVQELGRLQKRLTHALQAIVGAQKTYVVTFAEHGDYPHLHVHVIPRQPDHPQALKGPNVFRLLGVSPEQAVPQERRNELARQIHAFLTKEQP